MVEVRVIQGSREIGGNCIWIKDRDRVLVFDQGIRFSALRTYYSYRIEPKGIPELRQVNATTS